MVIAVFSPWWARPHGNWMDDTCQVSHLHVSLCFAEVVSQSFILWDVDCSGHTRGTQSISFSDALAGVPPLRG